MPDLISLDEAAKRLKFSRRTIDRYVKRGEFCALYAFPSGHLRVDANDLDAWLLGFRKTTPERNQDDPA
jgi:excisionase family DNA binding protein